MERSYDHVALVTLLALLLLLWKVVRVGQARARFGVEAPATVGHPQFERHYRVQMNMVEGLLLFLPALWLFALYWGELIAAGLGAVWLIGRLIYMFAYVKEPKSRSLGFGLQAAAALALLIGALVGCGRALIALGGL